jgi:hypothetical protein
MALGRSLDALEDWQRERARHLIAAMLRALPGGKGSDA